MKNSDNTVKMKQIKNELYERLMELPKFFEHASNGEFLTYIIPGYHQKKRYNVIADPHDINFRTEKFMHDIYHATEDGPDGYSLTLVSRSSNTVLYRWDLGKGQTHTNPDGTEIFGSHMHCFDRFNKSSVAVKIPDYLDTYSIVSIVKMYLNECNISNDSVIFQEELV